MHGAPAVAVVTAQRDAIVPLVIAGAGAALVPESVARAASAAPLLPVAAVTARSNQAARTWSSTSCVARLESRP